MQVHVFVQVTKVTLTDVFFYENLIEFNQFFDFLSLKFIKRPKMHDFEQIYVKKCLQDKYI